MKLHSLALLTSAAVLATVASNASAAVTVFNFSGTIAESIDSSGNINTVVGESFRGEFSYDPEIQPSTISNLEDDMGPFTRSLFSGKAYIKLFTPLGNSFGTADIFVDTYEGSSGGLLTINGSTFGAFPRVNFLTGISTDPTGALLPDNFAAGLNFFAEGTNDLGEGGKVVGTAIVTSTVVTPTTPAIPSAVPEPASWALMIGGFGLIGAAMRRRQRTTVRFA